jgi:hypothetical protein
MYGKKPAKPPKKLRAPKHQSAMTGKIHSSDSARFRDDAKERNREAAMLAMGHRLDEILARHKNKKWKGYNPLTLSLPEERRSALPNKKAGR